MYISTLKVSGVIFCAAITLTGCGTKQEGTVAAPPATLVKPVPATPIDKKKAELGGSTWNPEWNGIVAQAIPPAMLSTQVPRDVRQFCPAFYSMSGVDKRTFWAYFFQALAGAEAGLNPQVTVRHAALANVEHLPLSKVRTEGLLQLSYADRERYGCQFDPQADRNLKLSDPERTILQPENNLRCGVKILDNQIIEQGKPLLSRSSYWSTLRPGTVSYRVFAKQMTNPPTVCGLAEAREHRHAQRRKARPR